jgi:hypothetical protein
MNKRYEKSMPTKHAMLGKITAQQNGDLVIESPPIRREVAAEV